MKMWDEMYEKLSSIEDGWYKGLGNPRVEDTSRGPSEAFLTKIAPVMEALFFDGEPSWYCASSGYHGGLELEWSAPQGRDFWLSWNEETDEISLAVYEVEGAEVDNIAHVDFKFTTCAGVARILRILVDEFTCQEVML